jgi:carbonic anhydrase
MRHSDLTCTDIDNLSAVDALQLLKDGNNRYVEHPHEGTQHRVEISVAQHPFAIILGCADSRVIPELIFDRIQLMLSCLVNIFLNIIPIFRE